MSQWYYQMLGEEFGPVSTDSLRQIIADGMLEAADLVRPAQSSEWRPLRQTDLVNSINELTTDQPTELLTDLAELNFRFEESGASDKSARKPPAREQQPPATAAPEEPPAPKWFYQFFGQVLGPVTLQELVQLAESGNLNESDSVRCDVSGDWQPAGDVPELAAALILRSDDQADQGPQASVGSDRSLFAAAAAQAEKVKAAAVAAAEAAAAQAAAAQAAEAQAAEAQAAEAQEPAASAPTARPAAAPRSPGRRGGKKSEAQLVEDILSEVFAEPAPSRETTSGKPVEPPAAAHSQGSPESLVPGNTPGSAASAPGWSAASASVAAPRPSLSSPAHSLSRTRSSAGKSSGAGFSLPDRQVLIAVATIVLAVGGWFGYGILNRMINIDEPKYIRRVEESLAALEKLSSQASQSELDSLQSAIYLEFNQYIRDMTGAGAVSGNSKNCLAAINRLTELIRVDPRRNPDLRKKLMADAKQKVSDWKAKK